MAGVGSRLVGTNVAVMAVLLASLASPVSAEAASPTRSSAAAAQATLPTLPVGAESTGPDWAAPTRFSTATIDPVTGEVVREVSTVPVNYRDESGAWQPIDTSLVETDRSGFAAETAANSFEVLIPEDAGTRPVRVESEAEWVTLRLLGADGSPALVGEEATFEPSTALATESVESVNYTATPSGVKESVVLSAPPVEGAAGPVFEYELRAAAGLTPVATADGRIEVRTSAGGVEFEIPAPTMTDSAVDEPGFSAQIAMTLVATGEGTWRVTVTPDEAWLRDPARVYPVVVDPSITKEPGTLSCWIASATPNTTPRCGPGTDFIRVGIEAEGGKRRGLIKFGTGRLGVPAGATITDATVQLWLASARRVHLDEYTLRRMATPWNNQATWNTSGTEAWNGGDVAPSSAGGPTLSGQNDGYKNFDAETIMQHWLTNPEDNLGLMVRALFEQDMDNELAFVSSHHTNDNRVPKMVIEYLVPPVDLRVDPCAAECAAPWVTDSLAPELSASVAAEANENIQVEFEVREANPDGSVGSQVVASGTDVVAPGERATFTPTEDLDPGTHYHFRAAAVLDEQGALEKAWSDWGPFEVTPPLPGGVWLPEPLVVWDRGPTLTWGRYQDPSPSTDDDLVAYQVVRGCLSLPAGACTNPADAYDPAETRSGRLTVVATLPPTQTEFTDTTGTPSSPTQQTSYRYWVVPQTTDDEEHNTTGTAAAASIARDVALPRQGRVRRIITGDLDDATLVSATPNTNYPKLLQVASATPASAPQKRGVIRFDTSEVRGDLKVTSARVELNQTAAAGNLAGQIKLKGLLQGFEENSVSWTNAASATTPWDTAGGAFGATVSTVSSSGTGAQRLVFADPTGTPTLTNLVQSWVGDPASNHGFAVVGDSAAATAAALVPSESGEYDTTSWTQPRPRLVVEHLIKSPIETFQAPDMPQRLLPQDTTTVPVTVTNTSDTAWATGLSALYYWMTPGTETVAVSANAAAVPLFATGNSTRALQPGETATVQLSVNTPPNPPAAGYDLWVDLVDAAGNRWSMPTPGLNHPYYAEGDLTTAQSSARTELLAAGECATMPHGLLCPDRTVTQPSSNGAGLESFGSYHVEPTGGGGTLMTDLSSGNLAWNYDAFANPSLGPGMFLRATFNTLDPAGAPTETGTGRNWSIQAGALSRMHSVLTVQPNGPASLVDGDGTTHTWTRAADGTFTRPAGVHLELKSYVAADGTRYVFTDPAGTRFYYDTLGRPDRVVDMNSNALTFSYVSDSTSGSSEDWRKLSQITDSAGRVVATFGYLAASSSVKVRLSWVRDISGRFLILGYGPCAAGDTSNECVTSLTDTYSGTTPPATNPADAKVFNFEYAAGNVSPHVKLASVTDPANHDTSAISYYDTNHTYPTQPTVAVPSWISDMPRSITDRLHQVTELEFRDPEAGDLGAARTTDVYDHFEAPEPGVEPEVEPVKTQYGLDGFGRTIWTEVYDDNQSPSDLRTSLAWDGDHNLARLTAPSGAVSRWRYDAETGYPLKQWDPVAVATGGAPTRTTYTTTTIDPDGTGPMPPATATVPDLVETPMGHRTEFSYNGRGNPIQVLDARGNLKTYVWESGATGDDPGTVDSVTDARGNTTTYSYASGNSAKMGLPSRVTPPDDGNGVAAVPVDFTYNDRGQTLTATRSWSGQTRTSTVVYDRFGRPTSQTTPGTTAGTDRVTVTEYDQNDNVEEVTGPNGAVVDYVYDVRDQLVAQTLPGNGGTATRTVRTAYDPLGRVCREAAPLAALSDLTCSTTVAAHVTGYRLDQLGQVTEIDRYDNLAGQVSTHSYDYDRVGNVVAATDPKGNKTSAVYDDAGRLIALTDAAGFTSRTAYNPDGLVEASIDQAGNPVSYDYTKTGQLRTSTVRYTPAGSTNTQTRTTRFEYDQVGNQTHVYHPRVIEHGENTSPLFEQTLFDENNRPIEQRSAFDPLDTTPTTAQVNYTVPVKTYLDYNGFGDLQRQSRPTRATSGSLAANQWTPFTHGPSGEVATSTDPHGLETRYDYTPLGLQSKRTLTPTGGAGTRTMTWSYHPDGSLQARDDTAADATAALVDNTTHGGGTLATGGWSTVTPSEHSDVDVAQEGGTYRAFAADPGGTHTWNITVPDTGEYTVQVSCPGRARNASGASLEPAGARATSAQYTLTVDGDDTSTPLNQDNCLANPGWRTLGGTHTLTGGQSVTVVLASTASGVVVADAVRLRQAEMKRGFTYTYDANGNQTAITNDNTTARVRSIVSTFDSLNRVRTVQEREGIPEVTSPVLRSTTYGYDLASNLASVTAQRFAQGDTATPGDDRGNLALEMTSNYAYDPRNLLASVTADIDPDPAATVNRTWEYTYNSRGLLATFTKPDATAAGVGNTTTFDYFEPGLLKSSTERTAPDTNGATTLVARHRLEYDPDGNRISDIAAVQNPEDTTDWLRQTTRYTYTPRGQLAHVAKTQQDRGKNEAYTYDDASNIISQTVATKTTNFTYDLGRLDYALSDGVRADYTYDPYGRLVKVTGNFTGAPPSSAQELASYAYDGYDRVIQETHGIDSTKTTRYDPLDRPTVETHTDNDGTPKYRTTRYNYLGLSKTVAAEERYDSGTWRVAKAYVTGPAGKPLALRSIPASGDPTVRYYSLNPHGDTEALTNPSTGDTTTTYRYTAYGQPEAQGTKGEDDQQANNPDGAIPDVLNPYRFNSNRTDPATGNTDMGFRTYDPGINTFLTRDYYGGALSDMALGADPWNTNRYTYAGGNPITRIELDGHQNVPGDGAGSSGNSVHVQQQAAAGNGEWDIVYESAWEDREAAAAGDHNAGAGTIAGTGDLLDLLGMVGSPSYRYRMTSGQAGFGEQGASWVNSHIQHDPNSLDYKIMRLLGPPIPGATIAKTVQVGIKAGTRLGRAANSVRSAAPSTLTRAEALSGRASQRTVNEIAESMRTNGWQGAPIDVVELSGQRIVVDGHHRLAAARRAGIDVQYQVVDPSTVIGPGKYTSIDDILQSTYSVGRDRLR